MRIGGNLCYRALCIELRCRSAGNFRQARRTALEMQTANNSPATKLREAVCNKSLERSFRWLHYHRQLQHVGNFGGSVFGRPPIPVERYLFGEIDRSVANSGYLAHLRSHVDLFRAKDLSSRDKFFFAAAVVTRLVLPRIAFLV